MITGFSGLLWFNASVHYNLGPNWGIFLNPSLKPSHGIKHILQLELGLPNSPYGHNIIKYIIISWLRVAFDPEVCVYVAQEFRINPDEVSLTTSSWSLRWKLSLPWKLRVYAAPVWVDLCLNPFVHRNWESMIRFQMYVSYLCKVKCPLLHPCAYHIFSAYASLTLLYNYYLVIRTDTNKINIKNLNYLNPPT